MYHEKLCFLFPTELMIYRFNFVEFSFIPSSNSRQEKVQHCQEWYTIKPYLLTTGILAQTQHVLLGRWKVVSQIFEESARELFGLKHSAT